MNDFINFEQNFTGVTTGSTLNDYIKFTNLVLKYKIPDNTVYSNFIKYFERNEKK